METFNIKFEHISGIKNTLEEEGYEFGYSCFEELLPVEVFEVEERIVKDVKLQPDVDIEIPEMECTLPVPTVKLRELQLKDELCQKKVRQVNTNTDTSRSYYINRDGVLRKILEDNEEVFQTMVLPESSLTQCCNLLTIQQVTMGSNGSICQ